LEEWPLPTPKYGVPGRKVSEIDIFDDWRFKATQKWESSTEIQASFPGPDVLFTAKVGNVCEDRGTACCVKLHEEYYHDLLDPGQDRLPYVLVGISHVKSFKRIQMSHGEKYAYLSRFYAVRPTIPPTDIVAKSGLFCWVSETQEQLEWNGVSYHCPVIQFPTGFTESIADPTSVLVAYGINDVESRIVRVKKRDIALRLFSNRSFG
jgi:hypothetical protein